MPFWLMTMPKKKTSAQRSHDEAVRDLAEELKQDNWVVKANVEGGEKPSRIGAFTPDIDATKGGLRRICEVVTEKNFKGDRQAYIEFRNYCDEFDFHFFVVDKEGNRREVDPKTFEKK